VSRVAGAQIQFSLSVPANQSSVLFYTTSLSAPWAMVTNYPAAPTNRLIPFTAPITNGSGYYHLRSP
jgi:hypothetical protein